MKNLKIKFGLFSLLVIFATSIFLTSCEQPEIIDATEEQTPNAQDKMHLLMPHGFEILNQEEKIEYFGNLTEKDYARLAENHRAGSYLRSIDKYWELYDRMEEGQLVLDTDLSEVLSTEEIVALSNYQYDTIEERANCESWNYVYSYFSHHPYYQKRCAYERRCQEYRCCLPRMAYWTEYVSNTSCVTPGEYV